MYETTKKETYALQIMALAAKGNTCKAEVVKAGIEPQFAGKIAEELKIGGYLRIGKGSKARWEIAKDPEDVSMLDVMRCMSGKMNLDRGAGGKISDFFFHLQRSVEACFDEIKISDLGE